jgi:hypothetical protein
MVTGTAIAIDGGKSLGVPPKSNRKDSGKKSEGPASSETGPR